MRTLKSRTICLLCLSAARPQVLAPVTPALSWTSLRTYALARRTTRASNPSRMVLSDSVDRPRTRDGGGRGDDRPQGRRRESPFAGMNQTVARIRDSTSTSSSRSSAVNTSRGKDDKGKREGRRTKAMKMQSSLSNIPYGHRNRTKAAMSDMESFGDFDLLPNIKDAVSKEVLKGMLDIKPTPVQRLAIPALLGQETRRRSRVKSKEKEVEKEEATENITERSEFLLAAETGSGKTLAYLLPVVNALKQFEATDPGIAKYKEYFATQMAVIKDPTYVGPREVEPHPTMARPKAIILVPTAELVDQVGVVAKRLSHAVKFKARLFSANYSPTIINSEMYHPGGIDMVVATPHLLGSMADSDPNILSQVTHLVVDEADSLFDRSFSPKTSAIIDRALPSLKQLVLCSATIPKRLDNYLATSFPYMHRITTPNLHAIPRRVQLGVIDVSRDPYRNNKDLACADAIYSIGKDAAAKYEGGSDSDELDVKRIMVFVNEREKTQEVAQYLVSKGIDAVALHRDTEEQRQSEMLDSFTSSEPLKAPVPTTPAPTMARRSLANTKVIVATDLASRGIDTLAVRHVILYDVPHTTIDFIHRLGRAGRMGRRGRGIVLVGRDDRRDIVAEVRESMFMGQALV